MSALSKILRKQQGGRLAWWCPGCDEAHAVKVEGAGAWTWDGNADAPTFSPSVMVRGVVPLTAEQEAAIEQLDGFCPFPVVAVVCHSFVKAGKMEFLNDCTHGLAGHTVPIPKWPLDDDDGDTPSEEKAT